MKPGLKRALIIAPVLILLLVGVAVGGLLGNFYLRLPVTAPAPEIKAPTDEASIARGKYLAHHVTGCVGCHSPVHHDKSGEPIVEDKLGAGRVMITKEMGFPGTLVASNIASDETHGIGAWTDGEVLRAIREGVSRDGRALFPVMPYKSYAETLNDEDALAIIAYIRTIPPQANDPGPTTIDFPVSMFIRAAPTPVETPAGPWPKDKVERGRRLLRLASCNDCHDSVDERRQPIEGMALAGGQEFPLPGVGTVYASNITSDEATGIGSYSREDLLRVFKEGKNKSGRTLYGMPWLYYGNMTDDDLDAMLTALEKVPPVSNPVPPPDLKN